MHVAFFGGGGKGGVQGSPSDKSIVLKQFDLNLILHSML